MDRFSYSVASLVGAAFLGLVPAAGQQGPDYSKVETQATDLGHGLTALAGAGGNITVAVGTDGVIIVDTEFAPLHDKIKAAIAKLSPLPVKYAVNTHYHGDHTGGNAAFAKDGTIVVAHENVAKRMANPPRREWAAGHTGAQRRDAGADLFRPGHRSQRRRAESRAGLF